MDFFARQEAARRTTRWLVVAFLVSVVIIVTVISGVVAVLLRGSNPDVPAEGLGVLAAFVVGTVIVGATLVKVLMLRSGGSAVARSLGGQRVNRDAGDPATRRLINVVEEMAIASGIAVPEVYVLEDEDAINAFAAGNSPADAAIAVTRGALRRLNREELQGVIGHEFSHVLNGDMRLNVKLIGLTFGLLCIAIIGRTLLRFGPRGGGNNRDRGGAAAALMLIALALLVLGYLGVFFGQLMQAAVSRHRERLADASSVQFTRNPGGLKNALLKIAALAQGARLETPQVDEVAHMLFAPGIKRLFATHPAIPERIAELDPTFRIAQLPELVQQAQRASERQMAESAGAGAPDPRPAAPGPGFIDDITRLAVASHVGELDPRHVRFAEGLRAAIPKSLTDADSPDHARALMFALLVSSDEAVLARQRAIIEQAYGADFYARVVEQLPAAATLDPLLRLPTVHQLFPILRRLTPAERSRLSVVVAQLSSADARIDVFECCLSLLLSATLAEGLRAAAPHGSRSLTDTAAEITAVFTVLAANGATSPEDARQAYETGLDQILPRPHPAYAPLPNWQAPLGRALAVLAQLQPAAKRDLIEGMVRTIAHDNRLSAEESELLRTVCALLHCPLPPLPALSRQAH